MPELVFVLSGLVLRACTHCHFHLTCMADDHIKVVSLSLSLSVSLSHFLSFSLSLFLSQVFQPKRLVGDLALHSSVQKWPPKCGYGARCWRLACAYHHEESDERRQQLFQLSSF